MGKSLFFPEVEIAAEHFRQFCITVLNMRNGLASGLRCEYDEANQVILLQKGSVFAEGAQYSIDAKKVSYSMSAAIVRSITDVLLIVIEKGAPEVEFVVSKDHQDFAPDGTPVAPEEYANHFVLIPLAITIYPYGSVSYRDLRGNELCCKMCYADDEAIVNTISNGLTAAETIEDAKSVLSIADKKHSHGTIEINAGVLPLKHGGTGKATTGIGVSRVDANGFFTQPIPEGSILTDSGTANYQSFAETAIKSNLFQPLGRHLHRGDNINDLWVVGGLSAWWIDADNPPAGLPDALNPALNAEYYFSDPLFMEQLKYGDMVEQLIFAEYTPSVTMYSRTAYRIGTLGLWSDWVLGT